MTKVKRNGITYLVKESETGIARFAKKCLICKRDFLASRNTALFCSNACKQKNYRNLKKVIIE